jgi:hypothetical protein
MQMAKHPKMESALIRAYELASTGRYSDAAMVEAALEDEGFREVAGWINMPSIRDALTEICLSTRVKQAQGAHNQKR